jgi:hypothetical protein
MHDLEIFEPKTLQSVKFSFVFNKKPQFLRRSIACRYSKKSYLNRIYLSDLCLQEGEVAI